MREEEELLLGAQELLFFSHKRLLVVFGVVQLSPKLLLLVLEFLLRREVEDAMAVRALALLGGRRRELDVQRLGDVERAARARRRPLEPVADAARVVRVAAGQGDDLLVLGDL